MRFPNKLTVLLRDRSTGLPVKSVAIVLVLFAARKNDYYVGPLVANEEGQVEFTRAECEAAIRRAQQMFVMDYSGDLESCRPVIAVRLHPPAQVEIMCQQYKQSPSFWERGFTDPTRLFNDLQTVKNGEYEPAEIIATEEQILANPQLELRLVQKGS